MLPSSAFRIFGTVWGKEEKSKCIVAAGVVFRWIAPMSTAVLFTCSYREFLSIGFKIGSKFPAVAAYSRTSHPGTREI
ncbi:hypothetical protein A0H81_13381 [Grifola frondosa]|uniref:Uncharacterized protein n=1 Tax=Grifola frondosa TaxID=5627 RepID=A0A1C7LP95_GRIFR|nr:hypothetical protein A0H81_13381 [Grifola frondosa]